MPAWPGGECPDCGDHMPPNLITCQSCRALLNSDLEPNFVNIPEYIPLQELATTEENTSVHENSGQPSQQLTAEITAEDQQRVLLVPYRGLFANCPGCTAELKIPQQYAGAKVQCNHCLHVFTLGPEQKASQVQSIYSDCPHCQRRIRAGVQFANKNVACNHCGGALHIQYS